MKGVSFGQKPFKTLSNIVLQVELAPWVRILWPVTPRQVAKVILGHKRSPAERWKHHRCVQDDHTDRLICNMTFSDQVLTLTWGQIVEMTF